MINHSMVQIEILETPTSNVMTFYKDRIGIFPKRTLSLAVSIETRSTYEQDGKISRLKSARLLSRRPMFFAPKRRRF